MVPASGAAGKQSGILPGSALSGVTRAHEAEEDAARMIELDRRRRGQPAGRKSRRGVKMRQRCFLIRTLLAHVELSEKMEYIE